MGFCKVFPFLAPVGLFWVIFKNHQTYTFKKLSSLALKARRVNALTQTLPSRAMKDVTVSRQRARARSANQIQTFRFRLSRKVATPYIRCSGFFSPESLACLICISFQTPVSLLGNVSHTRLAIYAIDCYMLCQRTVRCPSRWLRLRPTELHVSWPRSRMGSRAEIDGRPRFFLFLRAGETR